MEITLEIPDVYAQDLPDFWACPLLPEIDDITLLDGYTVEEISFYA